jgi:hypothetical protein
MITQNVSDTKAVWLYSIILLRAPKLRVELSL